MVRVETNCSKDSFGFGGEPDTASDFDTAGVTKNRYCRTILRPLQDGVRYIPCWNTVHAVIR